MEQIVGLYGKTYHFWQVDRGDTVPMGEAQLMMSFTDASQVEKFKDGVEDRDTRYGVNQVEKKANRSHIEEPKIHEGMMHPKSLLWQEQTEVDTLTDADMIWKESPIDAKESSGGVTMEAA